MLHALIVLNGYKVSNHICIAYYIRDVLKKQDLYLIFNDLRYKRNSLTHYGKRMDFETAKDAIAKCKSPIKAINILLNIHAGEEG